MIIETCDSARLLLPSAIDLLGRCHAVMLAGNATHDNKPGDPSWKHYDFWTLISKATHHLGAVALSRPQWAMTVAHGVGPVELSIRDGSARKCLASRPWTGKEPDEDSLAMLVCNALFLNDLLMREEKFNV